MALSGEHPLELTKWVIGAVWGITLGILTFRNTEKPGTLGIIAAVAAIGLGYLIWLKSDQATLLTAIRIAAAILFIASQLACAMLTGRTRKNAE